MKLHINNLNNTQKTQIAKIVGCYAVDESETITRFADYSSNTSTARINAILARIAKITPNRVAVSF